MELRGTVAGVAVWDDFAHHPTAIATTISGLRNRVGSARILGRPRATIQHHEGRPDEGPPARQSRAGGQDFFALVRTSAGMSQLRLRRSAIARASRVTWSGLSGRSLPRRTPAIQVLVMSTGGSAVSTSCCSLPSHCGRPRRRERDHLPPRIQQLAAIRQGAALEAIPRWARQGGGVCLPAIASPTG